MENTNNQAQMEEPKKDFARLHGRMYVLRPNNGNQNAIGCNR